MASLVRTYPHLLPHLCCWNNAKQIQDITPFLFLVFQYAFLNDNDCFIKYKLDTIINSEKFKQVIDIKQPFIFHSFLESVFLYWYPNVIYTLGLLIMSPTSFLIYGFSPYHLFLIIFNLLLKHTYTHVCMCLVFCPISHSPEFTDYNTFMSVPCISYLLVRGGSLIRFSLLFWFWFCKTTSQVMLCTSIRKCIMSGCLSLCRY